MIKTKRIELAIGDARRRLNERANEAAKKYDQGAQRLSRESNERETRQAAERLRAESNEREAAKKYDQGAQRLRRESNERETRQAAERLRAESNEREAAKKYDQGAQRLRRESNERETRQAAERLRAESNERDRERRRRLNERADQALADYTRYFKAAQAPIIPFDLFEEAGSEEKFYLGSLDEDYEQETVSEMQRSWFDARDCLSAQQPDTRTIETQTDLSFLSY